MTKECIKTACPYCGVGCGVEVNQLGITGDKTHPANQGALCVKGSALAQSLQMPSRLLYPKFNGQEISWDKATDIIANAYHSAVTEYGEDSTAMYVSGQLLTEDYYLANKFMKGLVGSANIDTNSRLCMSSAVVAHNRAFGEDVVPVNYSDIDSAELIVICGANTAWTHPVLFRRIQQARENNPQLKLVVIDPRETVTAQQADLHLAISNDGDCDLFNGLVRYLRDTNGLNQAYIDAHTTGFDLVAKQVMSGQYTFNQLSETLQLSVEQLRTFYRWFADNKRVITLFCQGVNQSQSGSDKANAIINAHLATGKLGYQGAGPFSITGQPNAMGGREVGGLANQLAIHRGFDPQSIQLISDFWQTSRVARKPGLKAVDMFEAVERGDIKVIWIMATNPVVSMPDNLFVRRALEKCPMVIVSDITVDSDIAQYANLLLPAAGWGEKQGMVTNSDRMLTRQRQFIAAQGEAKSDWRAISEVAAKLSLLLKQENGFDFQSEVDVFREYAAMTGLNSDSGLLLDLSQFDAISAQEYQDWQPQRWGGERPFADGQFSYPDGKARFVVTQDRDETPQDTWWLNTGRQRDQWHTMTRTGHIAHLAASEPEPTVYLNSRCAAYLGVKEGEVVALSAHQSLHRIVTKVAIDTGLGDKQLFMSMHWAGKYGQNTQVNAILSRDVDPHSGQPAFKSQAVSIAPIDVKCYGLFLGEQFKPEPKLYQSFQSEQHTGIWRFADTAYVEKNDHLSLGINQSQRRVVLDLASGWLAVGIDDAGEQQIVRSLMIVSTQPLASNASQLAGLIGRPLRFSELLSIVAQEETSELVCSCFRVSDTQIQRALQSGDCDSVSQLQNKLKCGSNCGSCLPQISALVKQHNQARVVNQ